LTTDFADDTDAPKAFWVIGAVFSDRGRQGAAGLVKGWYEKQTFCHTQRHFK
jgi:hypothetical protein